MPLTTIAGQPVHVDPEGFLTDLTEWNEDLSDALAAAIGITLTAEHRDLVHWLREDFAQAGETATLRRVSQRRDIAVKHLFELFPVKPAKKMAYVAGLPKPRGCV